MSLPNDRERLGAMVIGAILLGGLPTFNLVPKLRRRHFPTPRQQAVFSAFARLGREKSEINYGIVATNIAGTTDSEQFEDKETGKSHLNAFLQACLLETPTHEHIRFLAGELIEQSVRDRWVTYATEEIPQLANNNSNTMETVNATINEQKDKLFSELMNYKDDTLSTKEIIEQYDDPEHQQKFIPTGYEKLDELLGEGLGAGELSIVAARTSEGKTSLALNIALNVAQLNQSVLFVSIEMNHRRLIERSIITTSGIAKTDMPLSANEQATMETAKRCLSRYPIDIVHDSWLTIAKLRGKLEERKLQRETDLLIVDYLQLMHADRESGNRTQDVSFISAGLKQIATDYDVPVLAVAQLSRETDKRVNKEPKLTDLRESGSIEQDADVVLLLQRQDQGLSEMEWIAKHNDKTPYPAGLTRVNVAKNRHGARGTILFEAIPHLFAFEELGRMSYENSV